MEVGVALMPYLSGNMKVEEVGPEDWALLEDIHYQRPNGDIVTTPKGSRSDGCSVPPSLPIAYTLLKKYGRKAGFGHDRGYRTGKLIINGVEVEASKKLIDEIFHESLHDDQWVPKSAVEVMYRAVAVFGYSSYQGKKESPDGTGAIL